MELMKWVEFRNYVPVSYHVALDIYFMIIADSSQSQPSFL